ncbi:oligoendopeptidase F [Eubacterium ruminantium]|uniref:oligoendopeptidase F n=1 Tax=Eubacterium ruminantium TaxID=42322 RepID=UPI001568BE5E|nr:oligoendopeptidase F [Eubacterium ruminantium]
MDNKIPKRNEVPEELTWNLSDIYKTNEDWENDYESAKKEADELQAAEGKFALSADSLYDFLKGYESCISKIYKLYGYAEMKRDQDTADAENQKLYARAQSLDVLISEKLSFVEPEILNLEEGKIEDYYKQNEKLKYFKCLLDEIIRTKEHTLSKEMEMLLASAGDMAESMQNAFSSLAYADLKFPDTHDEKGDVIQLTNGRFVPLQMSENREVRKEAFEKFYERYKSFANTWASLYDGQVKKQIFYAKARKYKSSYEAAVDRNNVSTTVCDNLINCVNKNLDKMHKYVKLRKKLLGYDELHMYDVYASMVSDYKCKVSFEEAKAISLEALKPLGDDYIKVLKEAYDNRWIDVVENEGKRGGAYSSGVYGVHPYVLLNWSDTLDDVFTLVHEMGHSMHTYYSNKAQSFFDSNYKIFVAEVASTTNEVLLLKYLLDKATSDKERAYLINHFLESFKGTLYRQTMFAEFEKESNKMAEEGTPLTADTLSGLYMNLNKKYFGEEMISDPLIAYEWCRIPHFYYNFYVYQYATSFSASVAIADRILKEGQKVVDDYKRFLRSGCTSDPVSLLKIAGVDLSTETPVQEALNVFEEYIELLFVEK